MQKDLFYFNIHHFVDVIIAHKLAIFSVYYCAVQDIKHYGDIFSSGVYRCNMLHCKELYKYISSIDIFGIFIVIKNKASIKQFHKQGKINIMEWKRLVMWLSMLLILFAAAVISGVTIYYKRPNWLGVKNELADSLNRADSIERVTKLAIKRQEQLKEDTTKRAPVPLGGDIVLNDLVEITPEQLSYFEKELYNKSEQLVKLSKEKDYTYNNLTQKANNLRDTIKQLNKNLQAFKDSISKAQADINKKVTESKQTIDKLGNEKKQLEDASKKYADLENQIKAKTDELAKVGEDMKKTLADNDKIKRENKTLLSDLNKAQQATKAANSKYDSLQKQYRTLQEQYEKKKDSLRMEGYKKYAAIYNGTKPDEVARILETMEAVHSANILARMQKKKASKVVEVMDPAKAADILKITIE